MRSIACLLLLFGIAQRGRADYILETATMGAASQNSGFTVSEFQLEGARFHVTAPTIVDHIGGHLFIVNSGGAPGSNGNFELYGAIVPIASPTSFPSGTVGTFVPLAETVFSPPSPSADILASLTVMLPVGDYALLFGSNRFGATGNGGMPFDNSELPGASTFFGNSLGWTDTTGENIRLTVTGTAVPEPSTLLLFSAGLVALTLWDRRRQKR